MKSLEEELSSTREKLAGVMMQLKEKELIISNKEAAMLNLQKDEYQRIVTYEQVENKDDENSVNKLALKVSKVMISITFFYYFLKFNLTKHLQFQYKKELFKNQVIGFFFLFSKFTIRIENMI